ncbi:MAG: SRPBCC family protein [Pseudomonadota bacterium]
MVSLPPLDKASALDPSYYTSAAVFAFEVSEILRRQWQVVGPASLVAAPGDVIVREIGGAPILVTRNSDGLLKGYFNICPHRAGPLAACDQRGLKRLRCGYHGWAYDLDGQLRSAPEMREAADFDPATISLRTIDVHEWRGQIYARAGEGLSFATAFEGVEDIIGAGLDAIGFHSGTVYDVEANWKVYVDNYLEGYHLPFVHPGLTEVVDYATYRSELGAYWSLQRSPVTGETGPYGAGEGLYFFIYPNTMLNIMPGRLQTNRVVPTGIGSCQVEFDFYYAPGAEERAPEDLAFSDQVQEEDRLICEHVQRGLTSGVYQPGRLSPAREEGVWHWHNLLRTVYADAGLKP